MKITGVEDKEVYFRRVVVMYCTSGVLDIQWLHWVM